MENKPHSQRIARGKFLDLVKEGHWEYVVRNNTSGAIAVIAVTDQRELILVDQYRIPTHSRVIELPAGLVGDDADNSGEPAIQAADRELLEETGYKAGSLKKITAGVSSGGLADERITLFFANNLKRIHEGGGTHAEDILVHLIPLHDVPQWLRQKQAAGYDVDFKVFAGLYFLLFELQQ